MAIDWIAPLLRSIAERPARIVYARSMDGTRRKLIRMDDRVGRGGYEKLHQLALHGWLAEETIPDGSREITTFRATALGRSRAGLAREAAAPRHRRLVRACKGCGGRLDAPGDSWSVDAGEGRCFRCVDPAGAAADDRLNRAVTKSSAYAGAAVALTSR